MRVRLTYTELRDGINAAPNTIPGIRLCGRLVPAYLRGQESVVLDLTEHEARSMRELGMLR